MTQPVNLQHTLLKEAEAASILNIEVATLRRWRWASKGPSYLKIGGAVRYDPVELAAYVDACRRISTSDLGQERVSHV